MSSNHRIAIAAAAVLGLAASAPAGAADVHCHPGVYVKNGKPASIKVTRFLYKTKVGGNTVFDEGLADKKLAADGEQHTWKSQKLNHAAEGVVVSATAIEYKNDNSGAGDGYGKKVTSRWITHDDACNDKTTYSHTITSSDP